MSCTSAQSPKVWKLTTCVGKGDASILTISKRSLLERTRSEAQSPQPQSTTRKLIAPKATLSRKGMSSHPRRLPDTGIALHAREQMMHAANADIGTKRRCNGGRAAEIPKGVAHDAFSNEGQASDLSKQLTGNAANIYGSLEPTLASEAAHPQGYTPTQKSAMNTAAQQSAGGSTAGVIGQGRLYASRTHNAGGAKAAIGEGVRNAGANLSNAAVGTEMANANLQQKQQQAGISGLQGLESSQLGAGEGALGLSNQALGVADQADANNPWMKILLQGMQTGGQVASAYAEKP